MLETYEEQEVEGIYACFGLVAFLPILYYYQFCINNSLLHFIGEIFGGIHVNSDCNDGEILMQSLGKCCSCSSDEHTRSCSSSGKGQISVPELLSTIKGPWALIYWQVT